MAKAKQTESIQHNAQQKHYPPSFPATYDPSSERLILTPSAFAKANLLYVQETGRLKLLEAKHITRRANLQSFLFVSVLSGMGTLEYDQKTYPLSEGQCLWIDCRKEHRYFSNPAHPWELRWVHFDGHNADRFYRLFADRFAPVITSGHFQAINRILIELTATNYRQTLEAELESHQLLTQLVTLLLVREQEEVTGKMYAVRQYLCEHCHEKQTLAELCARFGISKFFLIHEFKRCFDTTVMRYVAAQRLNQAKHMLRFSTMSMNEITEQCGYCDQNYFCRQFQKLEGITPSEYRARWRGQK